MIINAKELRRDPSPMLSDVEEEKNYEEEKSDFEYVHDFSKLKSVSKTKKTSEDLEIDENAEEEILESVDENGFLTVEGRRLLTKMIVNFCQKLANRNLYEYQQEVAENIVREFLLNDAEELALLFSRQSGKTEVLAVVIAGLLVIIESLAKSDQIRDLDQYKEGLWVGYFAGSTYQVETLFDRTSNLFENQIACEILEEIDEKKKTRGKILRVGKSFIFAKTAAKQSKVESKTYHICIIDECVSKGTLVSTAQFEDFYDKRNLKKIEDLKEGDKIYSFNTSLVKSEITEVEKVWCNGIREVYTLEDFSGQKLTLTGNHRIYTSIGWKTIKELISMDYSELLIYSFPPYYRDRIRSITFSGETEVWDLTTKSDNHNFYANGILVHNCQDVDAMMIKKCYGKDTQVLSEEGYFSIEDIVNNRMKVWQYPLQLVEPEFHENGIQDLYRITLSDGSFLDVTENHRHLIFRRNLKKPRYVETLNLKKGYRLAYIDTPSIDLFFLENKEGDYEKGLILGHFIGNGCLREIIKYSGKQENVEKLTESISKVFSSPLVSSQIKSCVNALYSKVPSLVDFFKGYNLWNKLGIDKNLGNRIIKNSKDFHRGLIEGLWETDGCVYVNSKIKKGALSYSSISQKLIRDLQRLLSLYGIHGNIKKTFNFPSKDGKERLKGLKNFKGRELFCIEIKDVNSVKNFYKNFSLNLKQGKLNDLYKVIKDKKEHNRSQFYPNGMKFKQIQRVEFIGSGETYCVTVPSEDHLFLVDNCKLGANSISPMLASTAGLFIKSGTPNTKVCELYESCVRTKRRNLEFEDLCPQTLSAFNKKIDQFKKDQKRLEDQIKILKYPRNKIEINLLKKRKEVLEQLFKDKETLIKNWENKETPRKFYFEVPWIIAAKENPRYLRYVQKEKQRLGEHSDEFLMSYDLVWMIERGMFITEKALRQCALPSLELVHTNHEVWKLLSQGEVFDSWNYSQTVGGLDWGKTNDSTVLTISFVDWQNPIFLTEDSDVCYFNKVILHWLELLGDDYEDQYPQIEDAMHRFNVKRLVMDANGVGDPIYDRFVNKFEGKCEIWGIKTNSAPVMNDLIKHWAGEIKQHRFWYPYNEDSKELREVKKFENQMKGWYKTWKNGYLTCHHDLKDKDAHDDYCNSAMFSSWGATTRLDNELEFGHGIFNRKTVKTYQDTHGIRKTPRSVRSWRRSR